MEHGISNESIKKLTKIQVLYPINIESMIYRLDLLTALCKLFFRETRLIYKELYESICQCKKNKILLQRRYSFGEMLSISGWPNVVEKKR